MMGEATLGKTCSAMSRSGEAPRAAVDSMNSLFRGEKPAFSGLGWQLVDATHNLPASGPWIPPVDFKAVYEKAWGVS